jgi:hypothetical protein
MRPRFARTGAGKGTPGFGMPKDEIQPDWPAGREDSACCCPAQPLVRVIIPATAERRHSVDLLLCGHHYRVSRQALAAARVRIEDLPGKAEAATAALLEPVQRDHAEIM